MSTVLYFETLFSLSLSLSLSHPLKTGPLLFIMLHIPGSMRRYAQANGYQFGSRQSANLVSAQCFLDPLHGFISFILWVAIDSNLRSEWMQLLVKMYRWVYDGSVFNRTTPHPQNMGA